MGLKPSGEMYLETIYVLIQKKSSVRSIDIAEYMSYTKPSVSRAGGQLKSEGYITIDSDNYITLTREGLCEAKKIYERHTVLTKVLMMLGIDEETASEDACRRNEEIIQAPKTPKSKRTITLHAEIMEMVKEYSSMLYDHKPTDRLFLTSKQSLTREMVRGCKLSGVKKIRIHDLRHPYVKHTTKIFSLRLKVFQAQPVPVALRKTRGAFLHLREGGSHNPFLQSCNKKLSSWSIPQSKMSLILYAISMRLSGYTSTLSMRRSVSSAVRPSELKTALAASCRLSCRTCSSCFCFACANTTA